MSNGYAGVGTVPVQIEDKDGDLSVRRCWTRRGSFVELCIHDPDREQLYLLDLSIEDAAKLAVMLRSPQWVPESVLQAAAEELQS